MDHYHIGIALGISVGLLAGLLFVALLFKKKILDMHFDERQELARGKAFQYGFLTLLATTYAYGISDILFGRWCDVLAGVAICLAAGLCVFAVTCILKDAYLSLREKPRKFMVLFALLSLFNLGLGVMYGVSGGLVEDGVLTFRAVNPILGAATLLILIVYIADHLLRDRAEEG
ncbi:hypothetical protein [uncultured Oscillibacter sp.]|uniref:hypothetical protein n=1 Tax=uncultured Oscillibacter sp. TaxID=876091 RepID=UPI0025E27CEF|nr:hypothetical protein [uncultured Oscillibacter sp.]